MASEIFLQDSGNNWWKITVNTDGSLETVSVGTQDGTIKLGDIQQSGAVDNDVARWDNTLSNWVPDDLSDKTNQTDFNNHSARHEDNGTDEINVDNLSGDLADAQDPKLHASTHQDNGSDEINVDNLSGDLADKQNPKTHGNTDHDPNFATITESNDESLFRLDAFPWRTDPEISPFIAERLSGFMGLWPMEVSVDRNANNRIDKITYTITDINIGGFPNTLTNTAEVTARDSNGNPTVINYLIRKDNGNDVTVQKQITWTNERISNIDTVEL